LKESTPFYLDQLHQELSARGAQVISEPENEPTNKFNMEQTERTEKNILFKKLFSVNCDFSFSNERQFPDRCKPRYRDIVKSKEPQNIGCTIRVLC